MMSGPITRETFILAEEAMKIATRLPTMWVIDGDDLKEVPVPSSVKETGTLPEGYTYGHRYWLIWFRRQCDLTCNVSTRIVRFHHRPPYARRVYEGRGIQWSRVSWDWHTYHVANWKTPVLLIRNSLKRSKRSSTARTILPLFQFQSMRAYVSLVLIFSLLLTTASHNLEA